MTVTRKRLGELVIRSEKPAELVNFYRNVIGLDVYASFGSTTFLKIADELEGHPQLLAIFDKAHSYSGPQQMNTNMSDSKTGTLHHFAFALEKDDFATELNRLTGMEVEFQLGEHPAFGWRSIYMYDPDGNSVELVCYDAAIFDPELRKKIGLGRKIR